MKLIRNKKGFTLAEVVIASALSGIILLAATHFFADFKRKNSKITGSIMNAVNRTQFEQIIGHDLANASFSFGALKIEDDIHDKNFFDYYYDVSCARDCDREIILETPTNIGAYSREIYFLIEDPRFPMKAFLNPSEAYDSSTSFQYLNYNNNLNLKVEIPGVEAVDQPKIWQKNALIYIHSPLTVRENDKFPELYPPVRYNYLGWVTKLDGKLKSEPIGEDIFINWDVRSMEEYTDEDIFLRSIPFIYGLSNTLNVSRVRIIRYRIQAYEHRGKVRGKVLRATKIIDGKFREFTIADDAKSLIFKRSDVSLPFIDIELVTQ